MGIAGRVDRVNRLQGVARAERVGSPVPPKCGPPFDQNNTCFHNPHGKIKSVPGDV